MEHKIKITVLTTLIGRVIDVSLRNASEQKLYVAAIKIQQQPWLSPGFDFDVLGRALGQNPKTHR